MKRYRLRVPAAQAEPALARMLDLFPGGLEEERDGDDVILAGYAERAPAGGLEADDVEPGWENGWRAYHRPVTVGRIWIGPPWSPQPAIGPHVVVIDPGRAFGTGGHGSTRAALELLHRLEPCSALDLGCGSGVLSIAAAKLGFDIVAALDIDPLAVGAAAENAARNGVALAVAQADVLADPLPPAPLWIANLELGLLRRLLERPDLPPLIVASGLLGPETVGGSERAVVDGWAAELVRP
ncbi:MAG TPA: 50S ribosomal protein L11 methyltransferase [Gaiellales bacterium]